MEKSDRRGDKNRTGEYVGAIIANLVLIWVFGKLSEWLPFLTESFSAVLPLFYISFAAAVIANFFFIIYDGRLFRSLMRVILNLISIAILVTLYYVFPFDFSAYQNYDWNLIARIIIAFSIFGTAIGAIIEFFQTLSVKKCI